VRSARLGVGAGVLGALVFGATVARAADPTGAPPPDAKALVAGPGSAPAAPPVKEDKLDVTNASVSAGGQISTGNSRLVAGSASGEYDTRFSDNGLGFSVVANYGRGAAPHKPFDTTAQNVQARARYDRYLLDPLSVFVINTGRHDKLQGLDFRYNLDPGVKYLFVQEASTKAWGELGYDFQYDIRNDDARVVDNGDGTITTYKKTHGDHSTRLFAGFTHAFNDAVNLTLGLEYLQSVVQTKRNRLNFDALFAAKLGGGLALGAGFSARYDHHPLADKKQLDTQSILSVIYSFSDAPPAEPPPPPPCTPVPPAPCPACSSAPPAPVPPAGAASPESPTPAGPTASPPGTPPPPAAPVAPVTPAPTH